VATPCWFDSGQGHQVLYRTNSRPYSNTRRFGRFFIGCLLTANSKARIVSIALRDRAVPHRREWIRDKEAISLGELMASHEEVTIVARKITRKQRSRLMSSIRGKDTKPEMIVRRFLHSQGLRYGLHAKDLPGSPDLVFRTRRTALFVHGCFWHRCPHCAVGKQEVRRNIEYWLPKLERNEARDARARTALKSTGWKVIIAWECQLNSRTYLERMFATLRNRSTTRKSSRPKA
jgi:DNA mismatch endonuclease (patch repair protein)